MTQTAFDIIIVGGGHAGGTLAMQLRKRSFTGSIALISNEAHLPYQRPPLSKDYLLGKKTAEDLYFRSPESWAALQVDTHLNNTVRYVHAQSKTLQANDETFHYGTLVWATGGNARRLDSLPGADCGGLWTIRGLADVDAFIPTLADVKTVAVIGAGYIGLEAAAVLRGLGKSVTVIEAQAHILGRVSAPAFGDLIQAYHEEKGITFHLGTGVEGFESEGGHVSAITLSNGERLATDCVIIGAGIIPAVAPLMSDGVAGPAGIPVDAYCQSADPHIYAIGDCAVFECVYAPGDAMRVESVQNAQDQATAVAKTLTAERTPYAALPTFWSDQYDLKIQTVGISRGYTDVVVRRDGGNPDAGTSVLYFREDLLIAVDAVNRMKDFIQARKLVNTFRTDDPHALADGAVQLKEFASHVTH